MNPPPGAPTRRRLHSDSPPPCSPTAKSAVSVRTTRTPALPAGLGRQTGRGNPLGSETGTSAALAGPGPHRPPPAQCHRQWRAPTRRGTDPRLRAAEPVDEKRAAGNLFKLASYQRRHQDKLLRHDDTRNKGLNERSAVCFGTQERGDKRRLSRSSATLTASCHVALGSLNDAGSMQRALEASAARLSHRNKQQFATRAPRTVGARTVHLEF